MLMQAYIRRAKTRASTSEKAIGGFGLRFVNPIRGQTCLNVELPRTDCFRRLPCTQSRAYFFS